MRRSLCSSLSSWRAWSFWLNVGWIKWERCKRMEEKMADEWAKDFDLWAQARPTILLQFQLCNFHKPGGPLNYFWCGIVVVLKQDATWHLVFSLGFYFFGGRAELFDMGFSFSTKYTYGGDLLSRRYHWWTNIKVEEFYAADSDGCSDLIVELGSHHWYKMYILQGECKAEIEKIIRPKCSKKYDVGPQSWRNISSSALLLERIISELRSSIGSWIHRPSHLHRIQPTSAAAARAHQ